MALFNLNQSSKTVRNQHMAALSEALNNQSATVFDSASATQFVGLESESSIKPEVAATLNKQFTDVKAVISGAMPELGEVGLESATRAAMMLGDTKGIANKLKGLGLESFSSENIGQYRDQTISVNGVVAEVT
eukprot:UN27513